MAIIKTTGVVIQENNLEDSDKMITLLTPNNGKISCAAKGAKRPKSTLMAGTQLLCFGEYIIYKTTNSYKINSCEPIQVFYNIRTDLEKLKYAMHITRIINDVTDENQNTYKILQLYLNTLYVISETDKNLRLVVAIFKLKLISLLGFTPQIEACTECGTKEKLLNFSFMNNGFQCNNCAKQDTSSLKISSTVIDAIRYIIKSPSKKIFSFELSEKNLRQLEVISKLYLNDKLEKEYKLEL